MGDERVEGQAEISFCSDRPTGPGELVDLVARTGAASWSPGQIQAALEDTACRLRLARASQPGSPGRWVGFVLARRVVDTLEVDLVGVDPDWRRQGLARRLLRDLLDDERTKGAAEARLELAAGNAEAFALYAGQGFVVVGRRARYYPDGDDALLLTARLEL